jgi:hypothetical protein
VEKRGDRKKMHKNMNTKKEFDYEFVVPHVYDFLNAVMSRSQVYRNFASKNWSAVTNSQVCRSMP